MERLILFAEKELLEMGPVKFQLSRVLEEAGISKSSAYHHFGGRDGIIAAAEMHSVFKQIEDNNKIKFMFAFAVSEGQSVMVV